MVFLTTSLLSNINNIRDNCFIHIKDLYTHTWSTIGSTSSKLQDYLKTSSTFIITFLSTRYRLYYNSIGIICRKIW